LHLDHAEHHGDSGRADQRAADQPEHGHAPRHQAGAVHQVAQDQPVADADDEPGTEQERPVLDGDERLAGHDERAGVAARGVLAQRQDRQDAEDADGDEGAFDDARRDVSEGEAFVLPF
jgi:hypothetical protein